MTIVYPDYPNHPEYGDLWKGKITRLGVHATIDIPETLFDAISTGTHHSDEAVKQAIYAWLDEIWQDKDARIGRMLAEFEA